MGGGRARPQLSSVPCHECTSCFCLLLALQGDLELIDKIIELEMNPKSEEEKEEEEEEEDSVGMSYVRSFFTSGRVPSG